MYQVQCLSGVSHNPENCCRGRGPRLVYRRDSKDFPLPGDLFFLHVTSRHGLEPSRSLGPPCCPQAPCHVIFVLVSGMTSMKRRRGSWWGRRSSSSSSSCSSRRRREEVTLYDGRQVLEVYQRCITLGGSLYSSVCCIFIGIYRGVSKVYYSRWITGHGSPQQLATCKRTRAGPGPIGLARARGIWNRRPTKLKTPKKVRDFLEVQGGSGT